MWLHPKGFIPLLVGSSLLLALPSCRPEEAYDRTLALEELPAVQASELVVLLETDEFVVLTSLEALRNTLGQWVQRYHLDEDQQLLRAVRGLATGKQSLTRADKLLANRLHVVAELLATSKCLVYNKRAQQVERRITVTPYPSSWSSGGRTFSVSGKLLLRVTDWVV
jgi:hypothetical protein